MRIVLNGWFAVHDVQTGSGQYLRALLEWLPRVAPEHEYHLVVPQSGLARLPLPEGAGYQVTAVRCGASNFDKVRFEQWQYPRLCRALRADLAHVPYWAPPLASPAPIVVTIHDIIPLLMPEYRRGRRAGLYTALVAAAARGVALALTDSQSSARDIQAHLHLPPEKVRAIYLAADPAYAPTGDWRVDDPIREKYGLTEGYVFYCGGFDRRKNLRALVSAWTWPAGAIGQNYPLVIAGQLPAPDGVMFEDLPALAQELQVADTVKFIGPVAEADKPALYRGATVFAYPSRYEGFGLPPLEAMASGVPVVTTTAGSLPEVVETAGYLLPPDDTRNFGAALITVVVEPQVHDDLRARGLAQAKKFSWQKTAKERAEAYQAAIKKA